MQVGRSHRRHRPGVIVLHPDLTLAAITGAAERWLAHIADHRPDRGRLPVAVYAVAARLQSIDNGMAWPGAASTVRVPSTTGGWLLIHASHLNSSAHGEIAVIIEPAHPRDVVTLLLNSQGLTPVNATLRCWCCAARRPKRSAPNCTYPSTPSKIT